jgi:hypothetical protein
MHVFKSDLQGSVFNQRTLAQTKLAVFTFPAAIYFAFVGQENRVLESSSNLDNLSEFVASLARQPEVQLLWHTLIVAS